MNRPVIYYTFCDKCKWNTETIVKDSKYYCKRCDTERKNYTPRKIK